MSTGPTAVAVVTGAAGALGRAIARELFAHGHHVRMVDLDEAALQTVSASFDPSGGRTSIAATDLKDGDAASLVVAEAVDDLGRVDVVINCAAVIRAQAMADITVDDWDEVLAVNLRSVFFLSRAAGDVMRANGWGRIVNIASLSGQMARPSGTHYGVAKAGLIGLTRALAAEYAPGVTVNAVSPGPVDTPMFRTFGQETADRIATGVPVGRIASPDEVAKLVAFLSSQHAGFITGATYDINGGLLMR